MRIRLQRWIAAGCLALLFAGGAARADEPPQIKHEPIATAMRQQPITVTARVTDDSGLVKYVTLFYSLSRDAAPFRIPMKLSGDDLYVGTIPPDLLGAVDKLVYYIEAMDQEERSQETPWYTVDIKDPAVPKPRVTEKKDPTPAPVVPAPAAPERREGASLLGIGIIAGGAAAVVGGALLIADQNKSSSGGDDDDDTDYAGTYVGEVVECFGLEGQSSACTTRSMSVIVGANREVSSSTLRENTVLSGTLNGNKFLLVADLSGSGTGVTGEVFYDGSILDNRLFGRITGRSSGPDGNGIYSGSFSSTKR